MGIPEGWSTPAIVFGIVVVVAMFALAIVFMVKFLRTFKLVRSQLMPLGGKVAFWGTLVYLISPVDILPDPVLFDDIAVLAGAISYIGHLAKSHGLIDARDAANIKAPLSDDDIIDSP